MSEYAVRTPPEVSAAMSTPMRGRNAILIVGSSTQNARFQHACMALGEALALAEFSVIGGSFNERTADAWVIRGVLRVDPGLAKVVRPQIMSEGPVTTDFASVAVETQVGDRNSARLAQLRQADAVLLIGGKGGTRAFHDLADKPVLAIPAFGGAAKDVFPRTREHLGQLGVSPDWRALEEWTQFTPTVVVGILTEVLNRRRPASFLLTWDPALTAFEETLQTAAEANTTKSTLWSASPDVKSSDRVYLMRHGSQGAGLVGAGTAVTAAFEQPHWDAARRALGESAWFVRVDWRVLSEYPIVPLERLRLLTRDDELELWTRQGTGHVISPELALEIDAMLEHATRRLATQPLDPKAGLVSIERLKDYRLSASVMQVLDAAIQMAATPRGADAAVTASLLLIAAYRGQGRTPNAWHFLQGTLARGDTEQGHRAIEQYFPFYAKQAGPPIEQRRAGDYPIGWLSAPVVDFLERAREYARAASGTDEIHARHLVAAIIRRTFNVEPVPGTCMLFERFGVEDRALSDDFLRWLETAGVYERGDERARWHHIFARRPERASGVHGHAIPRIELESPRGRDLLKIDRDVNPLAALIAARNLDPPLAIGLFGDWGSGKSFFMEKLRDRIDHLAHATLRRGGKKSSAFHGQIAQIWFNAWNYVEVNLWASLVTHIFESLHEKFAPPEAGETEHWRALLERMDKESTAGKEMQAELEAAQKSLADAQAEQIQKWKQVARATDQLWQELRQQHPKIRELSDILHEEDVRGLRDGLLQRHEEVNALLNQLGLIRVTFVKTLGSLQTLGWAGAFFVLILLLIIGAAYLADPGALRALGGGVAAVTAIAGSVLAGLGAAFQRTARVVGAVQSAATTIHKSLLAGKVDDSYLLAAKREMEAAARRVEEQKERVVALRTQIGELQPSRRLTAFLANRAESQDYRKHLGLPAMIRRDFERLQALMDQMRTRSFKLDPDLVQDAAGKTVPEALVAALRQHQIYLPADAKIDEQLVVQHSEIDYQIKVGPDGTCAIEWNRVRIDRIVLYIDDLDRCPSERVVEVLQAVRLLLDFKLFVVVVGVDARWVTQALNTHHARQWRGPKDGGNIDAPEPQDFLEKIFQVPLWLEPLNPIATKEYIVGLTTDTVRPLPAERKHVTDRPEQSAPAPRPSAGAAALISARAPADPAARPAEPIPVAPSKDSDARATASANAKPVSRPTSVLTSLQNTQAALDEPSDDVMNPPGLEMTSWEQGFMLELADVIGRSPRAVKRFVNVYRLIRSSVPAHELLTFTGTKELEGAYQVVQVLLAVVVGKPAIAEELFDSLRQPNCEPLAVLARGRASDEGLPRHKRKDWRELAAFLAPTKGASAFRAQAYVEPEWFERVSRYSFRVGRR